MKNSTRAVKKSSETQAVRKDAACKILQERAGSVEEPALWKKDSIDTQNRSSAPDQPKLPVTIERMQHLFCLSYRILHRIQHYEETGNHTNYG